MKQHEDIFIISHLSEVTYQSGKNGLQFPVRYIHLRGYQKPNTHPSHVVRFNREAVKHTLTLKVGDTVKLTYHIDVSQSRAKIPHTHIVPKKITIVTI